jgi:transposase
VDGSSDGIAMCQVAVSFVKTRIKEEPPMEEISTIGLDIAKSVFQVHGVNAGEQVVVRRSLKRRQVLTFFAALKPCLVGMEACATAHHWARELSALGHEVRLIPPSYVKAYVKRNKTDAADAAAICEAVSRPSMRFVPIKSKDQQSILMLHRTRRLLVGQRTRLINAIRSHLAEFGLVAGVGRRGVEALLQVISQESEQSPLPAQARVCLTLMAEQLELIKHQILELDRRILAYHRTSSLSRRLETIPGIGPLTSTALVASIPDARVFRSGRDLSAWIGLVPRQNGTGGKPRSGPISKAGDRYLRQLLVVGAMAVIRRARKPGYMGNPWLVQFLAKHRSAKLAAVALANKMARIAWALMVRGEAYRPALPVAA